MGLLYAIRYDDRPINPLDSEEIEPTHKSIGDCVSVLMKARGREIMSQTYSFAFSVS